MNSRSTKNTCHLLDEQVTLDESNQFDSKEFSMKEHSWLLLPLLVHSTSALPVAGLRFTERGCLDGDIGTIRGPELMPLLLAHADRLDKYGA